MRLRIGREIAAAVQEWLICCLVDKRLAASWAAENPELIAVGTISPYDGVAVAADSWWRARKARDALKIEGTTTKPVRNVVVDHCSFSWAIDETVSVWGAHDNITFSNNIFAEALNNSLHPNGAHGFGVGDSAGFTRPDWPAATPANMMIKTNACRISY